MSVLKKIPSSPERGEARFTKPIRQAGLVNLISKLFHPLSGMNEKIIFPILILAVMLSGCIGDDIEMDEVQEAVRILNPLDTIALGESYQFEAMFTNNIGDEEQRTVLWSSSEPAILDIDENGLANALATGMTELTATVELDGKPAVMDQITLVVGESTVSSGLIKTGNLVSTSSYDLAGSFMIDEIEGNLTISFSEDYEASTALPGLYVYLGNNPSSISGALEIGAVNVYDGPHSYQVNGVGINEYQYLLYWCKPFNVKVGEGLIE